MIIGVKVMAGHRPKTGCISGVKSTRRDARPTATGIRVLIQRRFGSGGIK